MGEKGGVGGTPHPDGGCFPLLELVFQAIWRPRQLSLRQSCSGQVFKLSFVRTRNLLLLMKTEILTSSHDSRNWAPEHRPVEPILYSDPARGSDTQGRAVVHTPGLGKVVMAPSLRP